MAFGRQKQSPRGDKPELRARRHGHQGERVRHGERLFAGPKRIQMRARAHMNETIGSQAEQGQPLGRRLAHLHACRRGFGPCHRPGSSKRAGASQRKTQRRSGVASRCWRDLYQRAQRRQVCKRRCAWV